MNSIMTRRSIRKFTRKPIEKEKLEHIIRAGMQAPSAHNSQPWEFLVVTEESDIAAVSEMSPYAKLAKAAPMLIITCCDRRRGLEEESGSKWWPEDLSACTENMLLQIVEEELGGVWLGFYPNEERVEQVSRYFQLPEYITPFSVIALGYGENENQFVDRFDPEKIHYSRF